MTPAADPIEIAVVGAHLSALPLNPQLTALGGRLVRAAQTAPVYRLYALAGAAPRRPGLVRAEAGEGAAIAAEVWALEPAAFGNFVAAVPPPLCIGTVLLADGTRPKGFLCETAGLAGATDITAFGGWRAYLASQNENAA